MGERGDPIPLQSLGPTPLTTPALSPPLSTNNPFSPAHSSPSTTPRQSVESSRSHQYPPSLHLPQEIPDVVEAHPELSTTERDVESPTGDYIPSLPPVDGGKAAWSFLVAATIMEMLIWGLPFAIGVLHEYWISTQFRGESEATITLAATLQTGLLYMSTAAFAP